MPEVAIDRNSSDRGRLDVIMPAATKPAAPATMARPQCHALSFRASELLPSRIRAIHEQKYGIADSRPTWSGLLMPKLLMMVGSQNPITNTPQICVNQIRARR